MLNDLPTTERCNGCHACFQACPVGAITMEVNAEGFLYPKIAEEKCINCGKCSRTCPLMNQPQVNPMAEARVCYARDPEIHSISSSGGIFAVLAEAILAEGGAVFGAVFDENMQVCHQMAEDNRGLALLQQTKYVQSIVGNTYADAEDALRRGRKVLFSGTPCQIAGLKSYLGSDHENLLTIDLICHGVPSPGIWARYLQELTDGRPLKAVTFRNKQKGIRDVTLDYTLTDGQMIQEKYADSLYIKGFIQNLYLRPSCHECPFKGKLRCSDLTIGDFWGAKEYLPHMEHRNGVSAVLVHSAKGKMWLGRCADALVMETTAIEKATVWNESLLKPAIPSPNRSSFWQDLDSVPLMDAIREHLIVPPVQRTSISRCLISKLKGRIKKWLA